MKNNQVQAQLERLPLVRLLAIAGILLIALCAMLGCSPKPPAGAEINPAGTYNLVSVDGKTLPCAVAHAGSPLVKSGSFVINADGTCSSRIVLSTPSGGETTREVQASYVRQGEFLTMKWIGAGTTRGRVAGDTFTLNNEGIVFTYRK